MFEPGTYVLEKGLKITGGNVSGQGVFFYNINADGKQHIDVGGNASVQLTAPTSGPYKGVLFFVNRSAPDRSPGNNIARGNEESFFEGAIYMPSQHLDFAGNPETAIHWTIVVVRTLNISGTAQVQVVNKPTTAQAPPPTAPSCGNSQLASRRNAMPANMWNDERGNAMVELALIVPLMMIMTFGATDFGRLFVESALLASASNAGAAVGYRTTKASTDNAAMEAAILADLGGLTGVTATAASYCDCPVTGVPVSCTTTTCAGFGYPRVYVKSTASKSFRTLTQYIGVPSEASMSVDTYLRVQ